MSEQYSTVDVQCKKQRKWREIINIHEQLYNARGQITLVPSELFTST